jgi:hypothetical protein
MSPCGFIVYSFGALHLIHITCEIFSTHISVAPPLMLYTNDRIWRGIISF